MDSSYKILIVDDERFYINVLSELLKEQYKLYIAKSGEQALQRLADNQPDLILLDIMMPDMDGYQTCLKIKQQAEWAGIPIIFLTGKTDSESEAKAFTCGAVDFISKPISPATVLARIKTHISLLNARQALEKQNQYLEETKDLVVCPTCLAEKPVQWAVRMEIAGWEVFFCRCPYCPEVFAKDPDQYVKRLQGEIPYDGVFGQAGCCSSD